MGRSRRTKVSKKNVRRHDGEDSNEAVDALAERRVVDRNIAVRPGPGLSQQTGAHPRAVPGRRQYRSDRAHHRRVAQPGVQPAVRGREPRRRLRHHRRRGHDQVARRRLHPVHDLARAGGERAADDRQEDLRSAEGLRARIDRRHQRLRARRDRIAAGEQPARVRCLRQGQRRQAQFFQRRARLDVASVRGAVRATRRRRDRAHPVQGRRPGRAGAARRPGTDVLRQLLRADPARRRRSSETAGRVGREARLTIAQRADHRRGRLPRLQDDHVQRPGRPGRDTARCDRPRVARSAEHGEGRGRRAEAHRDRCRAMGQHAQGDGRHDRQ